MRRLSWIIILFVALAPHEARACQCGTRPDARTAAAKWSDVVISGTVVEVEPMKLRFRFGGRKTTVATSRVLLKIDRIWKGSTNGHLVLTQGITSCDYPHFQKGRRYLVFASTTKLGDDADAKTGWSANRCLPTQEVGTAANDLTQLGGGVAVNPPRGQHRERESWFGRTNRTLGLSGATIVALLAALALAWIMFYRRRSTGRTR